MYANIDGDYNTAIGESALYANTAGNNNTALGSVALASNSSGNLNTAVGYYAGGYITSGSNNIAIGNQAQVPISTASNQVRIGNNNITDASINIAWEISSDRRMKSDIRETDLGLDFISKLNPVSYIRINDDRQRREYGFIAQEVEELLLSVGTEKNGITSVNEKGFYGVRYNDFIAPMVKATQELNHKLQLLQIENKEQQLLIENLKQQNEQLLQADASRWNDQQQQINALEVIVREMQAYKEKDSSDEKSKD